MVASAGLFLGKKERRAHLLFGEGFGDQFGVAHVAGVESQVQRPVALVGGVRRGAGQQGHVGGQQASAQQEAPQRVAEQRRHRKPAWSMK
jgi:hypothetical protein